MVQDGRSRLVLYFDLGVIDNAIPAKSMYTPYDIMVKLKVMFEDQNHNDRRKGIKVFLNTNMSKGDPRSSNRWKNPGRFDVHKVVEVI